MRTYLVTMGGTVQGESLWTKEGITRDFNKEAHRLVDSSAPYYTFDKFIILNNNFIKTCPQYKDHRDVLDKPSFGTAFKPVGFYNLMLQIDYGDIILWIDSNHVFQDTPKPIIDWVNSYDIFARDHFRTIYKNKQWTHRTTFVNMKCDEKKYWNAPQMQCNIIALLKNDFTMKFIKEFMDYSLDYNTMFGIGDYTDFPEFVTNRKEQSIFSILIKKYNIHYLIRDHFPEWEKIAPEDLDGIAA